MKRSLRKGTSAVHLEYEHTGDTIGAKAFAVEVVDGVAILSFVLHPVDSNQREDEEHLHELKLLSIQLDHEYVVRRFRDFVRRHHEAKAMRVDILSRGTKLSFAATLSKLDKGMLDIFVRPS